jgi:hypothetical protein
MRFAGFGREGLMVFLFLTGEEGVKPFHLESVNRATSAGQDLTRGCIRATGGDLRIRPAFHAETSTACLPLSAKRVEGLLV